MMNRSKRYNLGNKTEVVGMMNLCFFLEDKVSKSKDRTGSRISTGKRRKKCREQNY